MRKTPWIQQAWPTDPRVPSFRVQMAGVDRLGYLDLRQVPRWMDGGWWCRVLWDDDITHECGIESAQPVDGLVVLWFDGERPLEVAQFTG